MTFHIGVDVGGTFTDCVAITDAGHICHAKSLSTKADLTDGILHGLNGLAGELHVSIEELLGEVQDWVDTQRHFLSSPIPEYANAA